MRQKGERWSLQDGREVIVTNDLANEFVRIINERGMLEVIHESKLKYWLNAGDFPSTNKV